ncbi:MAG: hypothetical protein HQL33_05705 [Alphaproteobacteria bacterium]|nr:hypothetical protein [Alphaproteobacteria bacterium]
MWASIWLLALPLLGCGGTPPDRPPLALEQAATLDKRAHAAVRARQYPLARDLYGRLLRLRQSIEDLPGIATATINLASVEHLLGDDVASVRLLDAVLADPAGLFPDDIKAEAAFRRGVIAIGAGDRTAATSALLRARGLCASPCPRDAGLLNLEGRLALAEGDPQKALAAAGRAGTAAGLDREESANARRITARALAASGRLDEALAAYRLVLEEDKDLADARPISDDLDAIAELLVRMGRKEEADGYRQRAATVRAAIPLQEGRP